MTPLVFCVALLILFSVISGVLLVLFGQLTVRKLRKNPETKNVLGMVVMSGWDIYNVAQCFAIPRWMTRNIEGSKASYLYANFSLLLEHTNRFDRALGFVFYWFSIATAIYGITILILEKSGFF